MRWIWLNAFRGGDFERYGKLILKTWDQNKRIDSGTNPPEVEQIIDLIKDYTPGYKPPGAGGGGYLYMVAKDPEAVGRIRKVLQGIILLTIRRASWRCSYQTRVFRYRDRKSFNQFNKLFNFFL